jgi:3-oxoacid CoA-transferase A subunit
MIDKTVATADEAVSDIFDGAIIHIGGFSEPASVPSELIAALMRQGSKNLTVITNDAARGSNWLARDVAPAEFDGSYPLPDWFRPVGLLVENGQVSKAVTSAGGELKGGKETAAEQLIREGKMVVELQSQGTLAERIRAARVGVPAVYVPTGVGTFTAEGKEVREFDGRMYVLERALRADFALVTADLADRFGNLIFRGTARTMNAVMAGAADVTIAEVNRIVSPEEIDPERVGTPAPYVDRVVSRTRLI